MVNCSFQANSQATSSAIFPQLSNLNFFKNYWKKQQNNEVVKPQAKLNQIEHALSAVAFYKNMKQRTCKY